MRLLDSQRFKSNNCINDIHESCGLGFMCECGCHYPPQTLTSKENSDG